jgi:hypothetical protein
MSEKPRGLNPDFSEPAVRRRVLRQTSGQQVYQPRLAAVDRDLEEAVLAGRLAPDGGFVSPTIHDLGETAPVIGTEMPESAHQPCQVVGNDHPFRRED